VSLEYGVGGIVANFQSRLKLATGFWTHPKKTTKNIKEIKESPCKKLTEESVSIKLVDTRIEPVFIPQNTRKLRNGKTFQTKPEILTKYYLKTFDHFSKSFLNCSKLDIFKEKLVNFNIWLNNNITYVFKSFAENFFNFNLALKNLYMYKSDKKT